MTDPVTEQMGRRRAPRLRVRLSGSSITRAGSAKITILNISRHGAMVELQSPIAELRESGEMVVLGPGIELFGEVRRIAGPRVAIEFDEELPQHELLRLRALNEAPPRMNEERLWMMQARDWVRGEGGRAGLD